MGASDPDAGALFEAVPRDGVDAGADHRARVRALNAAAQEQERQVESARKEHAVDVRWAEAQRGHRRPRGASWPAPLRSRRTREATPPPEAEADSEEEKKTP